MDQSQRLKKPSFYLFLFFKTLVLVKNNMTDNKKDLAGVLDEITQIMSEDSSDEAKIQFIRKVIK